MFLQNAGVVENPGRKCPSDKDAVTGICPHLRLKDASLPGFSTTPAFASRRVYSFHES
jgi:hypothetical protein